MHQQFKEVQGLPETISSNEKVTKQILLQNLQRKHSFANTLISGLSHQVIWDSKLLFQVIQLIHDITILSYNFYIFLLKYPHISWANFMDESKKDFLLLSQISIKTIWYTSHRKTHLWLNLIEWKQPWCIATWTYWSRKIESTVRIHSENKNIFQPKTCREFKLESCEQNSSYDKIYGKLNLKIFIILRHAANNPHQNTPPQFECSYPIVLSTFWSSFRSPLLGQSLHSCACLNVLNLFKRLLFIVIFNFWDKPGVSKC